MSLEAQVRAVFLCPPPAMRLSYSASPVQVDRYALWEWGEEGAVEGERCVFVHVCWISMGVSGEANTNYPLCLV